MHYLCHITFRLINTRLSFSKVVNETINCNHTSLSANSDKFCNHLNLAFVSGQPQQVPAQSSFLTGRSKLGQHLLHHGHRLRLIAATEQIEMIDDVINIVKGFAH